MAMSTPSRRTASTRTVPPTNECRKSLSGDMTSMRPMSLASTEERTRRRRSAKAAVEALNSRQESRRTPPRTLREAGNRDSFKCSSKRDDSQQAKGSQSKSTDPITWKGWKRDTERSKRKRRLRADGSVQLGHACRPFLRRALQSGEGRRQADGRLGAASCLPARSHRFSFLHTRFAVQSGASTRLDKLFLDPRHLSYCRSLPLLAPSSPFVHP